MSLQSDSRVGDRSRVVHIAARTKLMGFCNAIFEPRPREPRCLCPIDLQQKLQKQPRRCCIIAEVPVDVISNAFVFLVRYATDLAGLPGAVCIRIFKSRLHSAVLVRCGAGAALRGRCSAQSGRAGQRRGSELRPWPRHFGDPEPGYFLPDCNRDPGSWLPQYLSLGKGATCMRPC